MHLLIQVNFHINYFDLILANVGLILKNEGSAFTKKINDELNNNLFGDFDVNKGTEVRQFGIQELEFLEDSFFPLISYIISILEIHSLDEDSKNTQQIFKNFSNKEVKAKFYEMIEDYIDFGKKPDYKKDPEDSKISKCYLLSLLIFDLFDFIYSNFYTVLDEFLTSKSVSLSIDPFLPLGEKLKPKGFNDLLTNLTSFLKNVYSTIDVVAELFIFINDIHQKKENQILKLQNKEDSWYVIFVPFNHLGFSTFCWISFKESKYSIQNSVIDPIYLFDLLLHSIHALIKKKGGNFRYMGLDLLTLNANTIKPNSLNSVNVFKNSSFITLLKDIVSIKFNENLEKSEYINELFVLYLTIFDETTRKDILSQLVKEYLSNDKELTFILNIIKSILETEGKKNNTTSTLLDLQFLKDLLIKTIIHNNLKPIDALDIISSGCSFLNWLLEFDHGLFNCKLGVCSKEFLVDMRQSLKDSNNSLRKWIQCFEDEKLKYLTDSGLSNPTTKEDFHNMDMLQKMFDIKKNQTMITINLIETLEDKIEKYSK